jgi:hypothetical protein
MASSKESKDPVNRRRKRISTQEKKCHTIKALALTNTQRVILYVSAYWVGKTHDYRMLLEEFPPDENWFEEFRVHVDLGFVGIEKDFDCKELSIPHKKPKKKELTAEQKAENKSLASKRVRVEHALARLKRYRILSDRLRMQDFKF